MEKVNYLFKQLVNAYNELKRVKKFHKQSALYFKQFYEALCKSTKLNGDVNNELQYMNVIYMSMIECFTNNVIF